MADKLPLEIYEEIWSLFKCESWNDNARLKSEKKKFRFFRNTPNKSKIYKELYIDWIRKIGRIARQSNIIPQWEIKTNGKKISGLRSLVIFSLMGPYTLPY